MVPKLMGLFVSPMYTLPHSHESLQTTPSIGPLIAPSVNGRKDGANALLF